MSPSEEAWAAYMSKPEDAPWSDADWPVGSKEVCARLGVHEATVWQWRQRGELPPEDATVGGRPAWRWGTIWQWAIETGRTQPGGKRSRGPDKQPRKRRTR